MKNSHTAPAHQKILNQPDRLAAPNFHYPLSRPPPQPKSIKQNGMDKIILIARDIMAENDSLLGRAHTESIYGKSD
ncbi:hypothetical protein LQR30_18625 [Chromobacterium piscinae]|uniref:hypothetical protein n=1 Tax=Chromobacterium piscinae TaxID=686831 RepID=UPI001E61DCDB|nr:hypothetical protein [Chromobacterium piscinae]MCD4506106.1 hypothetical protein [Chromobacterium piscinae]